MSLIISENPKPLEQRLPLLAETIRQVVCNIHPEIESINFGLISTTLFMRNGSRQEINKVYPNDPCPCNSGKKLKKCCLSTLDKPLICPYCKKEVKVIKDSMDTKTCKCYDPNTNKSISRDDDILS